MKIKNRIPVLTSLILSVVLTAGILTACGASRNELPVDAAVSEYKMAAVEEAAAETAAAGNYMYEEAAADESGVYMTGGETELIENPNRKLIKNVYIDLETKSFENITAAINRKVSEMGGYIECSNISYPNSYDNYVGRRSMNLSARIPSDRLDEFVNHISASGNVTYKSENVTDVTLQYKDTEGRKNSLLVEQKRLNELMKKAETVEDIIAIEARISTVRYELESIESQLRSYDNQVDYSTVNVNINEVIDFTPVKEDSTWERISKGFASSIKGIGEFFRNLFIGILAYSPVIILVAVVGAGIFFLVRALVTKGKNRKAKEEKQSEKMTEESPEE